MKLRPTLPLLLGVTCAGYLIAFLYAGRLEHLSTFDSIMTQDMAQIARNTLRGDILETKYVLPVAYARIRTLDNHPDYIRYPLPILTYALVFAILPHSPMTIKCLNLILFILNAALIYYIALWLFRQKNQWTFPSQWRQGIAFLCALSCSFLLLPYLRLALTDAYEVLSITILLIAFIGTCVHRNPVVAGVSATMLYLSRSNMAVFAPLMLLFLLLKSDGKKKVRVIVLFLVSSLLVVAPFLLRNLELVHKPFFSIQQSVELLKAVKGAHSVLYRSFAIPPSLFPMSFEEYCAFAWKILSNLCQPLRFAMNPSYFLPWFGLSLCPWFFKEKRLVLAICLGFVVLHTVICSLFLQLPRVYVPVFFLLVVLGYAGLVAMFATLLTSVLRHISVGVFAVCVLYIALSPVVFHRYLRSGSDQRTCPPSSTAVSELHDREIRHVYSNNPFWIPWHADVVAIYAPVNPQEMVTKGPSECFHYMLDKRYPFAADFLCHNSKLLYEDDGCFLFQIAKVSGKVH